MHIPVTDLTFLQKFLLGTLRNTIIPSEVWSTAPCNCSTAQNDPKENHHKWYPSCPWSTPFRPKLAWPDECRANLPSWVVTGPGLGVL